MQPPLPATEIEKEFWEQFEGDKCPVPHKMFVWIFCNNEPARVGLYCHKSNSYDSRSWLNTFILQDITTRREEEFEGVGV